jgi:hypothetical protein
MPVDLRNWRLKLARFPKSAGEGDFKDALIALDESLAGFANAAGVSKKQGLTEHRNWWPELYLTWCAQRGITPDDRAEAFAETYESKRPDLKTLPVSV